MNTFSPRITDPTAPIPAGWTCVCRTSDNTVREVAPCEPRMIAAVRALADSMRASLRSEGGLSGWSRRADQIWADMGGYGPRPLISL